MDIVLVPFLKVVLAILDIYTWMLIIYAILSWLLVFGIANPRNQFVLIVGGFLQRLIEPALRPLRRIILSWADLISPLLRYFLLFISSSFSLSDSSYVCLSKTLESGPLFS